jgi:hypothetical protein
VRIFPKISSKNTVSPKVPDALPGCAIGNRPAVMTAWLHYALGNSSRERSEAERPDKHCRTGLHFVSLRSPPPRRFAPPCGSLC